MTAKHTTESPIEVMMLAAVYRCIGRREGFTVSTQREVKTPAGLFRLDIALEHAGRRLAVECDGHAYHSTPEQRAKDTSRDLALLEAGWPVVRFTGSEILKSAEACAERVVSALEDNAPTTGPAYRCRVVLPGAALDALAVLVAYPSLASVADEENLPGLLPDGPLADLARDAMRDPVMPDEFVARAELVCDRVAVNRMVDLLGGERPDVETAEGWLRRACIKASLELVLAEQDRHHAVIARMDSAPTEEALIKAQVLSRRRHDIEKRLHRQEAA